MLTEQEGQRRLAYQSHWLHLPSAEPMMLTSDGRMREKQFGQRSNVKMLTGALLVM